MLAHKKKLKFNATKVQMYSLKYYILILYFVISHIFFIIYIVLQIFNYILMFKLVRVVLEEQTRRIPIITSETTCPYSLLFP